MQVMEENFFNSRELRLILAKHRGKAVPDRTLRFWRNELKIRPEPGHGSLYNREDLQTLIRLISWLSRGGSMQGFIYILKSEYEAQKEPSHATR